MHLHKLVYIYTSTGRAVEVQKDRAHNGFLDLLHALCGLPGDVNKFDHLKLGLDDVQVVVKAGTLAPLGYDGQLGLGSVAHKQQDVYMARFPGGQHHSG